MNRKTLGGAALVVAGGFLGRETLVWIFNKALDAVSSGVKNGVSFAGLSWQNSVAFCLIAIGLTLALWPKTKAQGETEERHDNLLDGAVAIINRVRQHRSAKWFNRDRLEPTGDIARAGMSLLLTYEKAGFHVPNFPQGLYAENVAVGLESYFSGLVQLISQGHISEAKGWSQSASSSAEAAARNLNVQEWFYSDI